MHRSIAALLVSGLALPGCLFGASSAVVHKKLSEGPSDPFLTAQAEATDSDRTAGSASNASSEPAQRPPQLKQVTTVDRNGVIGVDFDFEEPSASPADKAEWWNSPAAIEAAKNDGIKVPPPGSVQGRVGYASASYGMGQVSKP